MFETQRSSPAKFSVTFVYFAMQPNPAANCRSLTCQALGNSVLATSTQWRTRPTHLNLPILLRWENISPPPTNSSTMYRFELSYNTTRRQCQFQHARSCRSSSNPSLHTSRTIYRNNRKGTR